MEREQLRWACVGALGCLLVVSLGACGSDDADDATTTVATVASTSGPPPTIATSATSAVATVPVTAVPVETTIAVVETTVVETTSTTIVESTTTIAATPTTEDLGINLLLSPAGIGSHAFGTAFDAVVIDANAILGAAVADVVRDFPTPDGDMFVDVDGEYQFSEAVGREVCWVGQLCLTFGGPDVNNLVLKGWTYYANTDPAAGVPELRTVNGVTTNRRWAEFADRITVQPGGCYTIGYGATNDGIDLTLQGQFSDENLNPLLPEPAETVIVGMEAGDQMAFLFGDC